MGNTVKDVYIELAKEFCAELAADNMEKVQLINTKLNELQAQHPDICANLVDWMHSTKEKIVLLE